MLNRCVPALLLGATLTAQVQAADCRLSFQNGAILDLPMATTEATQARGLAGRADPGRGMLFLWTTPAVRFVWMKNTPAPLEAAWIGADGVIQSVQELEPHTTAKHSSLRPALGIIEVPRGQLANLGIERGSTITASTCFNL
ncbi:DUF192 domain-containing protein [Pseudomonas aeruginosa]|uniref:DUF192 domain-containing protein n=1 Tax=Pseudomonas monteilii TaxID=76759 RepID=A0A6H1Q870_9PSED|nr:MULTISPECIES: DUF192 domain-containing protein [Pseudomonas]EMF0866883.1 DUF192 domain-containing protein [Pseudomonas aeruginosa]WHL30357.1 DUF192 domain-containing protein [Pseudomonas juntendi]MCE0982011.1 DUF192 domain-containing protein [Pseudomonas monteilii]MCQ1992918.1 DUF192 domain-containing protein [Pseudomonas sp. Eb3]MEE1920247.1 DUF192 domain-containing protein [Pseudomonas asiatica]